MRSSSEKSVTANSLSQSPDSGRSKLVVNKPDVIVSSESVPSPASDLPLSPDDLSCLYEVELLSNDNLLAGD